MEPPPPTISPPWRFRLVALATCGLLVSMGILAQAALARRTDQRLRAGLIAELRRLDALQSSWAARSGRFAERIDETARDGVVAFTPASSVILQFASRPPDGWSAVVESREPLAAPAHCGIFRGPPSAAPHRALTHPGEVVCW